MQLSSWAVRAGTVLLLLLFAGAIVTMGRFGGSSYPPYSSLRSDQQGTKLLYEALQKTGRVEVVRDYLPMNQLNTHDAAVLYLGVHPASLLTADAVFLIGLENIAKAGNRIVVGIRDLPTTEPRPKTMPPIQKRWGIDPRDSDSPMIEKTFGAGGIVLLRHTEKLTNASLVKSDDARILIAALIGDKKKVVFEEAHLGIEERGSIAALIRRYHLQGLITGLLVVAGLFIWSRSVSFPPPSRFEEQFSAAVAASDSRDILVGLLSRHMRAESLIAACVTEWNRAHPDRAVATLPHENAVTAYQRIQNEVHRKHS